MDTAPSDCRRGLSIVVVLEFLQSWQRIFLAN